MSCYAGESCLRILGPAESQDWQEMFRGAQPLVFSQDGIPEPVTITTEESSSLPDPVPEVASLSDPLPVDRERLAQARTIDEALAQNRDLVFAFSEPQAFAAMLSAAVIASEQSYDIGLHTRPGDAEMSEASPDDDGLADVRAPAPDDSLGADLETDLVAPLHENELE